MPRWLGHVLREALCLSLMYTPARCLQAKEVGASGEIDRQYFQAVHGHPRISRLLRKL